jgi:hypothetical protein
MSDADLLELLAEGEPRRGWGVSQTVEIADHAVFVKMLPVTAVELETYPSTANLFDLPATYQYGVGSAGFGAGRELAAHERTTRWVLDGHIESFPLLHHHRLLPLAGQTRHRDTAELDRYVTYWDNDPAIRRFIEERQASEHAIVLLIEHVPHVLMNWLPEHEDAIGSVINQALEVTDFLRDRRVGHFDANPSNIVTDGERIFFTDFGLFLDDEFELRDVERAFLSDHRHFDIAEFVASLEWPVPGRTLSPGPGYQDALLPFRDVIDEMTAVFERLASGPKAQAGYDDHRIAEMLANARR